MNLVSREQDGAMDRQTRPQRKVPSYPLKPL